LLKNRISFQAPFATEEPEEKTSNVYAYDSEQWASLIKGTLIQLGILGFIHYKWGAAVPLVTQLILGPTKLYSSELFKSYILGQDLPRPFAAPKSPFADMMKAFSGEEEKPKTKAVKAKPVDVKKSKKDN
jgi:hypothetical protein